MAVGDRPMESRMNVEPAPAGLATVTCRRAIPQSREPAPGPILCPAYRRPPRAARDRTFRKCGPGRAAECPVPDRHLDATPAGSARTDNGDFGVRRTVLDGVRDQIDPPRAPAGPDRPGRRADLASKRRTRRMPFLPAKGSSSSRLRSTSDSTRTGDRRSTVAPDSRRVISRYSVIMRVSRLTSSLIARFISRRRAASRSYCASSSLMP